MKAKNSYFRFIIRREQLPDWAVVFLTVALGCLLVTRSYPLPAAGSDSFGYIDSALRDIFGIYRPFGYSAYLQLLHAISHSIYSIIVSQALIYSLSAGLLVLAIKKYWPPRRHWHFILFTFLAVFSPAAIFMLNAIYSDILFCSLVFIMLAMVMVFIKERSWVAIIVYAAALFCAMHARFSAMFFPLVFIPVFAIKGKWLERVVPIVLTVAAFLAFRAGVCADMKEITGERRFASAFSGWQLANNALHILPHLDMRERAIRNEDENINALHEYCVSSMKYIRKYTDNGKSTTAAFMWDNGSPLKKIVGICMKDYSMIYIQAWNYLGTGLYKEYGKWLILKYPGKFVRYFLLPNTREAFFPGYNEIVCGYVEAPPGKKELAEWFDASPDNGLHARNDVFGEITRPLFPWIELITWLVFLAAAVALFVCKAKPSRDTRIVLWLIFLFGFIYYGTTVFASPICLRYWLPMHAVKLSFAWIVFSMLKPRTDTESLSDNA